MKLKILFTIVTLFLSALTVSAQKEDKKKQNANPKLAVVEVQEIDPVESNGFIREELPQNGSLFTTQAENGNLLVDFKARKVGDLVFVDVVETSIATVSSDAERVKDSGSGGGGLANIAGLLPIPGAATVGTVLDNLSGGRDFQGSGATGRRSNVRARVTARVLEVLPNGDLRIQAIKLVRINKETEQLALTGIIRKTDLAADNSIPTNFIGDLRVEFNGKGVASKENAPGWLSRFFDKINPF